MGSNADRQTDMCMAVKVCPSEKYIAGAVFRIKHIFRSNAEVGGQNVYCAKCGTCGAVYVRDKSVNICVIGQVHEQVPVSYGSVIHCGVSWRNIDAIDDGDNSRAFRLHSWDVSNISYVCDVVGVCGYKSENE